MRVLWHRFGSVEAQLFEPEHGASRALLFCPGFPGMGATVFEQRHAAALVQSGYAVYVIKHKGTRLDGAFSPIMVNNAQRLWDAHEQGHKHLGGGIARIDDWFEEPVIVLNKISQLYDRIDIVGNSFGALSSLCALTQKDMDVSRVRSVLLYAGAQGVWNDADPLSIARIWKPEYVSLPAITAKVALDDPAEVCATIKEAYHALPDLVKTRLPDTVSLTYLVVEKDEILRVKDTQDFQSAIGGRGKIVMDTVDHAWPEAGLLAHDTPNYRTKDLLDLLNQG